MGLKRLVLFAEGVGDVAALPFLTAQLLTELNAWDVVFLDEKVFRVGGLEKLTGSKSGNWPRFLAAAAKRPDLGGVLVVLDGDHKHMRLSSDKAEKFCAAIAGRFLAQASRDVGGGQLFSVAVVFACQEYESWLIAGVESLAGKRFPDRREGIRQNVTVPESDIEKAPRNAKGWLGDNMLASYKPSIDQRQLTELVDLNEIRSRNLRSFSRFEKAIRELIDSIRTGNPIVTPADIHPVDS
jgi:hypothetical protein